MTVKNWIAADWPAPRGVVAGATTRKGGVSEGVFDSLNLGTHVGDDHAAVTENRRRFAESCALPTERLWLNQVHGTRVVVDPDSNNVAEADAVLTRRTDVVCLVQTADCLPVLFTTEDGQKIAAAHAGWRGLAGGVLEATVDAFSARPRELLAWFGPAISQTAFEVGAEVHQQFIAEDAAASAFFSENHRSRWQADLYGLATHRLHKAGVHNVYGGGFCTYSDSERFFSYRRDGQCGRMASFIYRET